VHQKPFGTNVCITGASSGIGLACAQLFSQQGYQVWGVSRSGTSNVPLPSSVHLSSMDVTQDDSVEAKVNCIWKEALEATGDGIGTVIHCAGFGIGGPAEDTPLESIYNQFETNYFGVVRVNRAFLPLMRSRGAGTVLVLGSIAGRLSIPYQSHYSSSKFALEAYVEALRMESSQFGIRSCIIEAGDTATAFTGRRAVVTPEASPYAQEALRAIAKMEHDEKSGYPAHTVAKKVLQVAAKRNPPVRAVVGFSYSLLMALKRVFPDRLTEWILRRMYLGR